MDTEESAHKLTQEENSAAVPAGMRTCWLEHRTCDRKVAMASAYLLSAYGICFPVIRSQISLVMLSQSEACSPSWMKSTAF